MRAESLAFVNQQLSGMLRSGLPLEGALHQLCRDLHDGALKQELERLQSDLARGLSLAEAMRDRKLPELYRRMVTLGAKGDDLPGTLALVADHYQQSHLLWTRLKGLMTYPMLVLLGCAALAGFVGWILLRLTGDGGRQLEVLFSGGISQGRVHSALLMMWAPVAGMAVLGLIALGAVALPPLRRRLRWRLPGFREGALAQLASTLHLLLAKGCPLAEAVALVQQLEHPSPASLELEQWSRRIESGEGKPAQFTAGGRVFPPLWRWLVAQGGADLASGFRRAAELYQARAMHQTEMLLYLALPMSVLVLGVVLLTECAPLVRLLTLQLDMLGSIE